MLAPISRPSDARSRVPVHHPLAARLAGSGKEDSSSGLNRFNLPVMHGTAYGTALFKRGCRPRVPCTSCLRSRVNRGHYDFRRS